MKKIFLISFIPVAISACTVHAIKVGQSPSSPANIPSLSLATETQEPTQMTESEAVEEIEIRDLVVKFGNKLQTVSLLSPDAAQEMEKQYTEFVVRTLLDIWKGDVTKAPGRLVSSPWPDRIEIASVEKKDSDSYEITGFIVEVTSVEVVSGGAAAKIPVHILVQKVEGHWMITEYEEER
jgi:hypothetical protein